MYYSVMGKWRKKKKKLLKVFFSVNVVEKQELLSQNQIPLRY